MARLRDTRSPSPTGSHSARKHPKDDERYNRSRRDDPRDRNRLSRSRSPASRRYRDNHRDRDGGRDGYRRRERSVDRRNDDHHYSSRRDGPGGRDRRRSRSRDRVGGKPRSPDRRRPRSRERDSYRGARGDDSREKNIDRRDGATDSRPRSRGDDLRPKNGPSAKEAEPAKSTQAQSEAEKKAERLRKLQAWKEKVAAEEAKKKGAAPVTTRNLLAEMDQKATGTPVTASPSAASPLKDGTSTPQSTKEASPLPYAGKFDPKAIAKAKATARSHSPKLGEIIGQPSIIKPAAFTSTSKASVLDKNRAISGFGFAKAAADADKVASKRKLDLDDEVTTKRKLLKLPDMALEETNGTAEVDQDEEDEGDDGLGDFEGTEEEAAAAARAAHERREERILQQSMAMETDEKTANTEVKVESALAAPEADKMEVDEDEVDPLDAFMAGLDESAPVQKPRQAAAKPAQEPEAYFSDDDFGFEADGADPKAILALAKNRKKKDIPTIDYSKLELKPIRKNFWHEPYELSQLTEEEANELRLELDGIKVSGKNIPKPVQKWSHCGLTRPILDTIEKLGYDKPTPIQMQALPVIMSGRDVIGVAKTGSGKTMAFLLPMFRHIMDQDPVKENEGPIALIMTPTRELCVQIHRDCRPFLKTLGLRAMAAYGGAPIKDQIAELKRGAEVVVATPGRMIDLLAANQGRVTNLKRATFLVLDEADRMFDMGFEPQVMKIFANVRPERQTILFSATMPRIIDSLTKKVLKDPVEITVGGRSVVAPEITQIVEIREEKDKFVRTLELLGELYKDDDDVRSLIFVERQEKADDLLRELLRRGYGCMSLHGGKDQGDRDSTIQDFKAGICPILVATSVAARGLDVKQLKLVINYDAPNHLEDYVHRAGRTGRAGNTGTAVTFVTPDQENCAVGIAKALEQSGQPVPERLAEMRKAFKDKVKEGKAKDNSGFGGKGLERLDKEREAARLRERKTHKTEGDEDDVKEEDKDDEEKKKKAEKTVLSAASAIQSRDATKAEGTETKPAVNEPVIKASAVMPGKASSSGSGGALDKAASAISEINARLARAGQLRSGQSIDNKGPDAGAFHATLEINDFPQKARWAVTNRTNVAKILEATGTSITTKGTFYAAGKEPAPGADPKLYILIEGDTEVVVGNALAEMTRLLKEGTIAAADADNRAPASGRYTIT